MKMNKDKADVAPAQAGSIPTKADTAQRWYTSGKTSPPHFQGLVYDEGTGANIAVTYDDEGGHKARLIATAPSLLAERDALREALQAMLSIHGDEQAHFCRCDLCDEGRAALALSEGKGDK